MPHLNMLNRDSEVNASAALRSWPSSKYAAKVTTGTMTGMDWMRKPVNACNRGPNSSATS